MSAFRPLANASMLPQAIETLIPVGLRLLRVEPITGSGSNRRYWRLIFEDAPELIATLGSVREENEAFIYLAELFAHRGINVPKLVAVSPDSMAYLQTSVGTRSLFECLERKDLIAKSMRLLADVHSVEGIDYSRCYPVAEMDCRAIMWDLNYFKYCFLKTSPGVNIDEGALEDDFERLAADLLQAEPKAFMVRDFQSRNVMISPDDEPYLIDFQGGRLGPVYYDVASFLWQARAGFSSELLSEMISVYCAATGMDETGFRRVLPTFVIFRLLQVLGAYGFRGRFERKEHFLASIPPALASLKAEITPRYPYLYDLAARL